MTTRPVHNKADMYRRLAAGEFGNTIPQWFDRDVWRDDPRSGQYPLWGIRSQLAGGCRKMRLNVPVGEVYDLFGEWFPSGGGNISPMIDMFAVLRGEVIDTIHAPTIGLSLFYVPPGAEIDPADPWRGSFRNFGRLAYGAAAWSILAAYLWPSDLEDLRVMIDEFPEHTIELSACDRAVGIVPHRNTVIWEVRRY